MMRPIDQDDYRHERRPYVAPTPSVWPNPKRILNGLVIAVVVPACFIMAALLVQMRDEQMMQGMRLRAIEIQLGMTPLTFERRRTSPGDSSGK